MNTRSIRRLGFRAWAAILVVVFGVGSFGLITLVLGWFESVQGVAGPVTDLGYGALVGILLTMALLVQLWAPERKIAGIQQAALVSPAMLIGSAIASDFQNVIPALIVMPAVAILLVLHPAREEFFRRGAAISPKLLAITILGSIPLIAYALDMGAQARALAGPPHHVQRLSTMAAVAIAIVLAGLLAALGTRGWRIPAWSAGTAAIVFGLASTMFPDHPGAEGRGWGVVAIAGGALFIAVAERERRGPGRRGRVHGEDARPAHPRLDTSSRFGDADCSACRLPAPPIQGAIWVTVGASGSLEPRSRRKGGYRSVIRAAYATTRSTHRFIPSTRSKIVRG